MITKLFDYRQEDKIISTNLGDKKLLIIRKGPRGIVSVIEEDGPVVIWDINNADSHENDLEIDLIQKTIDILNS